MERTLHIYSDSLFQQLKTKEAHNLPNVSIQLTYPMYDIANSKKA
jgi:hypothetical protein